MRKLNRKDIKKNASSFFKKNYFMSILIIFLFTLIVNDSYTFSSELIKNKEESHDIVNIIYDKDTGKIDFNKLNEDNKKENNEKMKGVIAPLVSRLNIGKSPLYNLSFSIKLFFYDHKINSGIISLIAALISLLIYFLIKIVLEVGKNRFYLESRLYEKTNVIRLLFPYKTRKLLHISFILFLKRIYTVLWSITIIGGFYKMYEYLMIPYILAENPTIKTKDAFRLSKEMMNGYKWETFKLDLTFIGWEILGLITLGFSNLLYFNAYKEFIYAELYYRIRKDKYDELTNNKLLNDTYLFENKDKLKVYPDDKINFKVRKIKINTDYNQKYSVKNLILLFFTASFIGYSWEVLLHIIVDGRFVNRGFMFGPWLPIYGVGTILILSCLKPFRDKPIMFVFSSMILAGIVEYSTSWILEFFIHKEWWNYTGYFCNLHGRICLEGLLLFGFGGAGITYFIAPVLNSLFNKIKGKTIIVICSILLTLFGVDFIYSVIHPNTGEGITSY